MAKEEHAHNASREEEEEGEAARERGSTRSEAAEEDISGAVGEGEAWNCVKAGLNWVVELEELELEELELEELELEELEEVEEESISSLEGR